ncbi:MAG TPA: prepilin-type N-terminal cleavage/methylation domain-containing protein [Fimbriimonadaceae bacterium]|nr:prepilin-type N-terminal cleavage/methylation domain-containing protein [Fimbriimonadaceae bacterium]
MRRRRGFTLSELIVGLGIMSFVMLGLVNLMMYGLKSFQKTTTDTDLAQKNAQGMRRLVETLRSAVSVTLSSDGTQITYNLPRMSTATDQLTGEREVQVPITSDGVNRVFVVSGGNLRDLSTNRTLVSNVATRDPDPTSTQYNQVYAPFQLTTIGSRRAVTVTLITQQSVLGKPRYVRFKTTVLIRNSP